jgi:MOSC domain-containing protein YiiM
MSSLLSVNVGRPRDVPTGRRVVRTAIWKAPVAGRVAARGVNLEGDDQADRSVHGGPDKAVYAYAVEDTRWWEERLGRELGPGAFGENLTVEGVDVSGARTGDRWAVGSAVFEVSQPRLPCFKLGLRMGDPTFLKQFGQAGRPGAYLRIVTEGDVGAGDAVAVTRQTEHDVSIRVMAHAVLTDRTMLPDLLVIPALPVAWREWIEELAV